MSPCSCVIHRGLLLDLKCVCENLVKAEEQCHGIGHFLYKTWRARTGTSSVPPSERLESICHRMPAKIGHILLFLLSLNHCLRSAGAFYLQPCEPINETVSVEKEGCPKCLVFQTAICSGHCLTKEPVYKSPLSTVYQHICTYRDVRYETIRLPDCPPWVDPHVTYPVALSCDCSLCTMETSDCTIESLSPDFCMSQRAPLQAY